MEELASTPDANTALAGIGFPDPAEGIRMRRREFIAGLGATAGESQAILVSACRNISLRRSPKTLRSVRAIYPARPCYKRPGYAGAVIAYDPLSDDPEAVVFEFGRELVSAHVAHKAAVR
jgi:hypothetical protein